MPARDCLHCEPALARRKADDGGFEIGHIAQNLAARLPGFIGVRKEKDRDIPVPTLCGVTLATNVAVKVAPAVT